VHTAAVLFAALQLGAQVGDWRVIMTSSDGTITLVDGASVRRAGSALTFWQKDQHPDGSTEGARIRLYCRANVWQILYQQNVNAQGRIVSTLDKPLQPREIHAGSAMAKVQARICPVLMRN
jgi:hypothetical protein